MDSNKYAKLAEQYKQTVSNRFSAIDREGIQKRIYGSDGYLVTTKYDGHFYLLVIENGKSSFINKKAESKQN